MKYRFTAETLVPIQVYTARERRIRKIVGGALALVGIAALGASVVTASQVIRLRPAEIAEAAEDQLLSPASESEQKCTIYAEGSGPAPDWYRPWEPMSVEWFADESTPDCNEVQRKDIGCPDWNLETSFTGWDGHLAEEWELDLFARIMYLEFWGTSDVCCEAGADSILRLWESEYFGRTLGETLTAVSENGALIYTTYGFVWDVQYDPDGLAEMKELCEERFYGGPEWCAAFFQLGGYPEWAIPCYEIDGVYFSTFANAVNAEG